MNEMYRFAWDEWENMILYDDISLEEIIEGEDEWIYSGQMLLRLFRNDKLRSDFIKHYEYHLFREFIY